MPMQESNWHLAGFYESIAQNALTQINAVQDQAIALNAASNLLMPEQMRLLYAYAGGANLQRARLNTPSLRDIGLPYITPLNLALTPPVPKAVYDWGPDGPLIPANDEFSVETIHNDVAAQVNLAVVAFGARFKPSPAGKRQNLRFTSTITLTAGTWVNGTLTPDQTLPTGRYAVVGMSAWGASLLAVRLVVPGGAIYRPGVIVTTLATSWDWPGFRDGRLGQYCTFDSVSLPSIDALGTAAGAQAIEAFLDVVKVG